MNIMNLSTLDLNLLRVLDALLVENSTTRAGQRIGLTQSAVSAALGRLRHALNDPLFVRQGQRLVPTDFARSLETPLRRTLDELQTLLSGPEGFDPARATSSFKLSGSDFYATLLMPKLAELLGRKAPNMTVQLVDLVPDSYVGILENAEIDIALIPKSPFPAWIAHHPMHRSRFVVIARAGHDRLHRAGLRPGDTIPIDLFCDMGHVLFSPEGKRAGMGDAALAATGRKRRVVMTLPVFSGVVNAVAASDLIALLPHQFAEHSAKRFGLEIYLPPMPTPEPELCMVWHERATLNPAHRWLREQVAKILADLRD